MEPVESEQLDRIVAAIRAHGFILQILAALALSKDSDPPAGARQLKAVAGDKFADAPPTESWVPAARQAKINQFSAHFVEEFWDRVEKMLVAQRTSQHPGW